ncbi:MAG TPA: endonuclease [Rhodospirillaceae bacterium]|nr:endonuclease [Rhodospirillaceae bacterium]|tara:strand:- start:1512 stop:2339 length:828 start_codon:yes stop_codon:yes gene_type:complete
MAAPEREKLAINQATTMKQWSLREAVEGYAARDIRGISVWRDKLAECGVEVAAELLRDNGMTVTGLCRGGMFPANDDAGRQAAHDDNRRAVDEAAAIGAQCLVMVCGGLPDGSKDMIDARIQVADGLERMLHYAREAGVPVAIEPLHPMTAADRACVNTLEHALDLCDALGEGIGVAVDVYHVWWDPKLEDQIARAADRILGFHVCDWLVPTVDLVWDRGMMGDGVIDIPRIRGWVEAAGYRGFNEIEIFSERNWWQRDPEEVVETCIDRYAEFV